MSELIEPPLEDKETASVLHVAKNRFNREDSAIFDKNRDKIVLYDGGIYVLYDYNRHRLTFAVDYYTYKLLAPTTDRFSITTGHNVFSITEPGGRLDMRMSTSREQHYSHYEYFMKTHIDLTDKTEDEINAFHLEILKVAIHRKMVDIPSIEQIKAREVQHRSILRGDLYKTLCTISDKIYETAKKGKLAVSISFTTITEKRITAYGALPRFAKFPCGDGRLRETFVEYFHYLFEGIYKRHADEEEPIWIWARIVEQVRGIFPHLIVDCGSMEELMPKVLIRFNIDVSLQEIIH